MAEPVTIGKQTFIKTPTGWVDKKTKAQAPENLFKLLNSLTSESSGEYKKLRVRIDAGKPPVTLSGEEYVFDLNQNKWINKKTRDPVNDTLQNIINGALAQVDTEKAAAAPAITGAMGTVGQAAKSTVKKPDGTKMPVNIKINSPIVSMIEKLATIDGYLKQRLDNQKKIAARNISMARETAIEATPTDASPVQEVVTEDASKNNAAAIGTAVLVGGLIAAQFEPVQEAFKSLVDGVKGVWNFVSGAAGTIADGLDAFTGTSTKKTVDPAIPTGSSSQTSIRASSPNTVAAPSEGTPSEVNQADASAVIAPQTSNQTMSSTPSSGSERLGRTIVGAAVGGAVAGPVGAIVGGTVGFLSAPRTDASATQVSTSPQVTPASRSSAPSSSATPSAANTNSSGQPTQAAGNIVQVNHSDTGPGYGIAGATDQQGRPIAFSKEGAEAFSRMMADSGGAVKTSDVASSKRSAQKNAAVGGATNSPHLRGVAMDIHGTSANWIRQNGHRYGWKPHDYPGTHGGHFVFGGQGMTPDEGSSSIGSQIQGAAGAIYNLGAGAIEALGAVISAGLGPIKARGITESLQQSAPNTAGEIAIAAVNRNAQMAEVKTPAIDTGLAIKDPPNISKSGSDFVQNIPTSSDMAGVDYYLTRMGFPKIEYHVPVQQVRYT